jgi:hypothetical protein
MGCVLITLFLSEWFIPDSDMKHTISFTLTIGIGALAFWFTRTKMSVKEKEIRSKIDQLKSEGQALKYEQEVAMTADDLEILRQKRFFYTLVLIFAMLLFVSIALLIIHTLVELESKILIEIGAVVLLIGIFGYVIRIILKKDEDVRKKGTKTVVRGIVTDKRVEGDETDTYVLEIENIVIDVKKKIYSKYQVGDGIEMHLLKNYYNIVLYEAKIESMSLK